LLRRRFLHLQAMRPLIAFFFASALALTAQESSPQTEYLGRVIAQTMHWKGAEWLMRRMRESEEAGTRMHDELHLKPGMTVCDMGCGNGYHTIPLAEKVGEQGKVYAVDLQPEMIEMLKANLDRKGIKNVVPIQGRVDDPQLPPGSCDLILLVDVYHEFSHPVAMLTAMRAALKPGGRLALVEFRSEDASVPIKPEHKMSKAQINREMTANGLVLVREYDGLPWQHLMFFGKAGEGGERKP